MANTKDIKTQSKNWSKYDFLVNKHYWLKEGFENALPIRINNLKDVVEILKKENIRYWLQGKTLLGFYNEKQFFDDHDDDISIWEGDREDFEKNVLPKLIGEGFEVIRDNEKMISVCRDFRYIDICIFKQRGKIVGYGKKWFPKHLFEEFDYIEVYDGLFSVPKNSIRLLEIMYNPGITYRIGNLLRRLKKSNPSNYKNRANELAVKIGFRLPHSLRKVTNIPFSLLGVRYKQLNKKDFLNLNVEPLDSFNWKWRKPHLDIITDNGKYVKIRDIVSYLKTENTLNNIVDNINETDTSEKFYEPVNLDQKFWQSGNNYFMYCILYEYKKSVIPYNSANNYIEKIGYPKLYTAEYYESLPDMNEDEIIKLFKIDPIEINNNSVTSGKHRVCAMIGRLISEKDYIPMWAIIK